MSPPTDLKSILITWTGEFMHRSSRDFRKFMENAGLSPSQVSILMGLYHGKSLGVTDIGEKLGVSSAAASQAIDRLVQLRLIERTEDPDDRRMKRMALTPKGRELTASCVAARIHWLDEVIAVLTPNEQQQLADAFELMMTAMQRIQSK
jgi:DNA-binding MarR family transcriptional regulator